MHLFSLPVTASVTLAVFVMMVMVMTLLFAVMVFASGFWIDVRDYHLAFIANHFAVTSPIVRVVQRFLTRRWSVMVMAFTTLLLLRITQIVPGLAIRFA